jgi:DNA polymerase-3 subunit delta'
MADPVNFSSFVGNARVVRILRRAIEQGRVPHALIFAGPPGVGKRTLAGLLAKRLNCLSPEGGDSCGKCKSCKKIAANSHPDVRFVEPDGTLIKIDQVRAIIVEVAYQPFEGSYRLVVFDGADRMRPEGANSLLKTLEEPPSRTILVLVTTQPYLLLATIRSRAQLLQFAAIPEDRLARHLEEVVGMQPGDAQLAAALSHGSLGAALTFDIAVHRELRAGAMSFVSLLLGKGSFAEASRLASGVAKDRERFLAWLEMADSVLQEVYYGQVAPERIGCRDGSGEVMSLARRAPHSAVVSAIGAFRKIRRAVSYNVNRQVALEGLFLAQAADQDWLPDLPGT